MHVNLCSVYVDLSLLKVVLTGVDVDAIYERTVAVTKAAGDVVVGARLIAATLELAKGLN